MRKQSKILSLLLALSLLLVVFFVLPASAEDDFVPATTEIELELTDEHTPPSALIDYELEGNVYSKFTSGIKTRNGENALKIYMVSEPETGKNYLKIVSTVNGVVGANAYLNTHVLEYDETEDCNLTGAEGWFVYEFDIACDETIMANMKITPVIQKVGEGNKYCPGITMAELFNNDYANADSWNHVTIVGRMSNGEQLVYVNNERVSAGRYFSNDANANWKFIGCRFELEGSATTTAGEGYLLDNLSCRIFKTNEAADNLGDSGWTNSDWSESIYDAQKNSPKLPALATVDGTPVYSASALLAAINGNEANKNVEILRNFNTELVVTASAVVETHGLNVKLTAGTGTSSTTEGTVVTFDTAWKPTASEEALGHGDEYTPPSLLIDTTVPGNVYAPYGSGLKLYNDGAEMLKIAKVTNLDTNNSYLKIAPNMTGNIGSANPWFTTEVLQYAEGEAEQALILTHGKGFYVFEFDLATDSDIIDGMRIQPVLKPVGGGSTAWPTAIEMADLINGTEDSWVHVTIVGNMASGEQLVYVNNERVTQDWGEGPKNVSYVNTSEGDWKFIGCRFEIPGNTDISENESVLLDNLSCRIYKETEDADNLGDSGWTNSDWSETIYTSPLEKLPAIAKVGDEKVYSLANLNAALAEGDDTTVEFLRNFAGTAVTARGAVVKTHGYGNVTCKNAPTTVGGKVVSGSLAVTAEDEVVTFTKITEENLTTYTVATRWVIDAANRVIEEIYFLEGDKISYIGNTTLKTNYIEDGKLYNAYWADRTGAEIVDFGTAVKGQNYAFTLAYNTTDTDITIKNELKYNLSLYTNFNVNLYVPADKTTLTGETVTLGEAQFVVVTKSVAAPAVAEGVAFEVTYTVDGVEYTEKVTVNVVDYAVAVLDGEYSHKIKRVMITALEYANEAAKLLNGAADDAITAVLENPAYAEFHVDANTEYGTTDNSALAGVISGANLVLDSEVKVVLTVADGFNGTITVNYNDYKGVAQTEQVFEVVAGDVIELNVKVYNLGCEFVIATDGVSGTYSLGAYIKGLIEQGVDADFAQALFTYAKTAEAYKLALNAAE